MRLAPVLPYITWGLIWDPQNKRGIPEKILILFIIEENIKRLNSKYIQ